MTQRRRAPAPMSELTAMENGSYPNDSDALRSSPLAAPQAGRGSSNVASQKGLPMKRNTWFALPLPSPRRLARVAPFVFATAAAHATTDWVDTHTKAFLTGPQLMAQRGAVARTGRR